MNIINKLKEKRPVTTAVRPVPSIPWVTSSAVEEEENPDGPFLPKNHISLFTKFSLTHTSNKAEKIKDRWSYMVQ